MRSSKIRIIKKKHVGDANVISQCPDRERVCDREIALTVTAWIDDRQRRRVEESRLAYERFFPDSSRAGTPGIEVTDLGGLNYARI